MKLFLPIFKMNFPEIVDLALRGARAPSRVVFGALAKHFCVLLLARVPVGEGADWCSRGRAALPDKIMHGLWGMGQTCLRRPRGRQMMFTKYLVVVDDDVDVHNTSEVLFRLCANTDPQRDSIFTKGPADVLDHATSEIAMGSKLGIDATKKIPGEGFKRPWPPLIKMDAAVKAKVEKLFQSVAADVRRLKLKGLKARKIIAQGKRSETSAALGNEQQIEQAL